MTRCNATLVLTHRHAAFRVVAVFPGLASIMPKGGLHGGQSYHPCPLQHSRHDLERLGPGAPSQLGAMVHAAANRCSLGCKCRSWTDGPKNQCCSCSGSARCHTHPDRAQCTATNPNLHPTSFLTSFVGRSAHFFRFKCTMADSGRVWWLAIAVACQVNPRVGFRALKYCSGCL